MIQKMNNKCVNFYNYLGRFFGSRIVYFTTKDRIYDDNDKDWYIYTDKYDHVTSFLSISKNKIKNVYSTNTDDLKTLLDAVLKVEKIVPSTVTKIYLDIYKKCGMNISSGNQKNFVNIWSKEK